jgi:hypothetical protein
MGDGRPVRECATPERLVSVLSKEEGLKRKLVEDIRHEKML